MATTHMWAIGTKTTLPLVNIPPYFSWIQWISPVKYGFAAVTKNEFSKLHYQIERISSLQKLHYVITHSLTVAGAVCLITAAGLSFYCKASEYSNQVSKLSDRKSSFFCAFSFLLTRALCFYVSRFLHINTYMFINLLISSKVLLKISTSHHRLNS
jgi:hypothetical protein